MTTEEKRQRLIVRQSQMERAIQYSNLIGIQPTPGDLLAIVEVFTAFIYEEEGCFNRAKKMDEYLKEQYKA